MSTTTIPLNPQPPAGIDVELLSGNGAGYLNHAMTVGQGSDTEFYACPVGVPLTVRREECGAWVWVLAPAALPGGAQHG